MTPAVMRAAKLERVGDPVTRDDVASQLRGARPELDGVAREVIRARARDALFGRRSSVRVGRYDLLRAIGVGGGGAVFAAHDPELDREVAVKLIAASTPELRARALAEGQALARLAHPNVVPVFDVGVSDDRVYLVMELVRGVSLREHAHHAKSTRALVKAWRQAAEGLHAAHAAGLVHRDFKPENALIGADERVRVIDFGLAIGETVEARAAGTPRYMAPEQLRGGAITAACDQYAFGVALGEAVRASAQQPPRWLTDIVARATAEDPAERFASMRELVAALADDPATRWRRRALIAAPVAIAITGVMGFALGRRDDAPTCDADAALGSVWTLARRTAIEEHVRELATPFAIGEAARVPPLVDAYAARWLAISGDGCRALRSGEATDALLDRRIACLARARTRLDATLELFERADRATLAAAASALAELPDLERCSDADALVDTVEPPPPPLASEVARLGGELDHVRVGIEAATPHTVDAAAAIVARARGVGYRPLIADALLVQGRAALALDRWEASLAPLDKAGSLALASGADAIAVEAYARHLWVRLRTTPPETALASFAMMRGFAERLGPRDRFARALLDNNAGVAELARGDSAAARKHFESALAIGRDVTGPGAVELAFARPNLTLVAVDEAERTRVFAEALAVLHARLGDEHPLTLVTNVKAAFSDPAPPTALAGLRTTCDRLAELHPERANVIAECSSEVAWLELAYGSRTRARAAFERVADASGEASLAGSVALARAYLALLDGDARRAVTDFEALAQQLAPPATAAWWEVLAAADAELGLVVAARAAGARDVARSALARAIADLERVAAIQRSAPVLRRLAWARSLAVP